jgi:hypothetical protein
MKIFEVMEVKKPVDDLDDVVDKPEDADQDKIPHILMQLRKALDVDGDYTITFKDGKKTKLPMDVIVTFIKKYMDARPDDKEALQSQAANSLEGFMSAVKKDISRPEVPKIKGSRYMSHFAGDFDDK